MSALRDLRGKLVLVTGGGAGIGRAICLAFAKLGANVAATDIDAGALAELKTAVEALGARCSTHLVNVTDEAAMKRLADDLAAGDGVPDVFVNNAGIGFLGPFFENTLDHWPRVFGVNVFGVVNGCRHVVPAMIAAGTPKRVVVVASGASHYPPPNAGAYGASKAAVFSFAESLKMDLTGTKVGVTTVCPGITNTNIVNRPPEPGQTISEEQRQRMRDYYAKNGATPEQIADAVVEGVRKGKGLVLVGPASRLMFNLSRISLGLTRSISLAAAGRAGFK